MANNQIAIIGAGLAGCECALVLARLGLFLTLFEQKPACRSAAHQSEELAELVCSNSLRSEEATSAIGLLKEEMRFLRSPFMAAADACRVPAGKALAVDRKKFSSFLTRQIRDEPLINLVEKQISSLADPVLADFEIIVCAAGPMASEGLARSLCELTGTGNCYFYDAIAPIVWTHSLNREIVFKASRYAQGEEEGDYLNCPFTREEYERFYEALLGGQVMAAHEFEKETHFEGCMPIEALAARGPKTLTFGPLKPVGLTDPRTGRRPYAILQLRPETLNGEACNLVGCQTKLLQDEQRRIFSLVPGLENVEFIRYGSMHRNIYVNAPKALTDELSLRGRPDVFLCGQITGVEGYVESAASGLWLALAIAGRLLNQRLTPPPPATALGSLLMHLQTDSKNFQPSNANFGLMPEPAERLHKKERKQFYSARAQSSFAEWLGQNALPW